MKSKMGIELSKLKPFLNLMSQSDRKIILNSKLWSILDYGLPLYMGESLQVREKLEAAFMTVNRLIKGGWNFKVSKVKICAEIKVDMPNQHMHKTVALYMHKHLLHRKCHAFVNQLIIPKRMASSIYVKKPQVGIYNASLDKCTENYNLFFLCRVLRWNDMHV